MTTDDPSVQLTPRYLYLEAFLLLERAYDTVDLDRSNVNTTAATQSMFTVLCIHRNSIVLRSQLGWTTTADVVDQQQT
jgi:hypothetical protein